MQRAAYVERIRRIIYGGMPPADADLTEGMVNNVLNDALAAAVKDNWIENIKVDGCECINNSFFSSFSGIQITSDASFGMYNFSLPSIPSALGKNEAISAVYIIDENGRQSRPVIMLSANQVAYSDYLPQMNGVFGWNEGIVFKLKSPKFSLQDCKAKVTMVNTGGTDLESEMNVPEEYFSGIMSYVLKIFSIQPSKEFVNDGVDSK